MWDKIREFIVFLIIYCSIILLSRISDRQSISIQASRYSIWKKMTILRICISKWYNCMSSGHGNLEKCKPEQTLINIIPSTCLWLHLML